MLLDPDSSLKKINRFRWFLTENILLWKSNFGTFWCGLAVRNFKKNALSSGYQYHMGHLILYILKSYSTTKVMLITMQNLCIVICIQNWILLCECGHWGYPILGLPHTDEVKTILWFMTILLKTRDMVLHPFLINLDRAHYLYDISLFIKPNTYIWVGILSKGFHTCNRNREMINIWSNSLRIILPDWAIWILKLVSNTSDDVMPWWRYLALIPAFSVTDVRKAITSCLTFVSIWWILLALIFPLISIL